MQKIIPPNVKEVNTGQPVRIQRKCTKGWRIADQSQREVVYVGRSSKWGNPYTVENSGSAERALELYEADLMNEIEIEEGNLIEIKEELGDKDLACWCPLDQPCHADILLDLANQETNLE